MTVRVTVECDQPGCTQTHTSAARPGHGLPSQARHTAQHDGWTRTDQHDLCPQHTEEGR